MRPLPSAISPADRVERDARAPRRTAGDSPSSANATAWMPSAPLRPGAPRRSAATRRRDQPALHDRADDADEAEDAAGRRRRTCRSRPSVKRRNVCSMPANQRTIMKLMATAAPMPGHADGGAKRGRGRCGDGAPHRLAAPLGRQRLGQRAQRQQQVDRRRGRPRRTPASVPSRPSTGKRDSSPPMNGPKMKPRPKAMPMMPMPRARCSGGVTSAM